MKLYETNHNNNSNNNVDIKPLVSIIIATYRRDTSLEKAVLSLINQSYEFIEIIVVDDNADQLWNKKVDGIISNIKMQSKREIIYMKNEVNKGSAETRNIGIGKAAGEYITFLDDDDVYLPKKVENQVIHMMELGSDFSITDLILYNEKQKLIEHRRRKYIKKLDSESLLKYHLMYHMTGTDTIMFKKDYLINIGSFDPIDVGDEFYLMMKAILKGGKFSYLPKCDVKAYIHSGSGGLSSGDCKVKGENELYQYKKKLFIKLNKEEKNYIRMRHYAVLAFAEYRRKQLARFLRYAFLSFIASPFKCIKEFVRIVFSR